MRTSVGPEQEYFLVDKELYDRRPDLIFTGRTLFGAKPPKGQELDDHYFGAIKPRVAAFMEELNEELWKLGILAKTEHNEVAPAQHELAPIYTTTNIATDHNQLTMEIMQKVAAKHGLVCLLHEKPFAGVNGSRQAQQLVHRHRYRREPARPPARRPTKTPSSCCSSARSSRRWTTTRICCASRWPRAGNDHRLGANEAPPAVVSIFLGDELTARAGRHRDGCALQRQPRDSR